MKLGEPPGKKADQPEGCQAHGRHPLRHLSVVGAHGKYFTSEFGTGSLSWGVQRLQLLRVTTIRRRPRIPIQGCMCRRNPKILNFSMHTPHTF